MGDPKPNGFAVANIFNANNIDVAASLYYFMCIYVKLAKTVIITMVDYKEEYNRICNFLQLQTTFCIV